MNPDLALLLVLAIAVSPFWLPKIGFRVWRRCICGALYCRRCGRGH